MHPHSQGEAPYTGVGRGDGREDFDEVKWVLGVLGQRDSRHGLDETRGPFRKTSFM